MAKVEKAMAVEKATPETIVTDVTTAADGTTVMIGVVGTPVVEVVVTVVMIEMIVVIDGGIMATLRTRVTRRGGPRRLSGPGVS